MGAKKQEIRRVAKTAEALDLVGIARATQNCKKQLLLSSVSCDGFETKF